MSSTEFRVNENQDKPKPKGNPPGVRFAYQTPTTENCVVGLGHEQYEADPSQTTKISGQEKADTSNPEGIPQEYEVHHFGKGKKGERELKESN
ncbi:hypothetical protein NLJ89_g3548 [Agrocybe chaxingu]|uniref:Uncharacterized protein n=1 Tax=Agrocybe chaxingu TaxID=84603 RepID=A0A9W8MX97_9AGAR|nr:hypothetical protein NLJ89_g3548 [Agrocybe chaxingu]